MICFDEELLDVTLTKPPVLGLLENLQLMMQYVLDIFRRPLSLGSYSVSLWQVLLLSILMCFLGWAIGSLISNKRN